MPFHISYLPRAIPLLLSPKQDAITMRNKNARAPFDSQTEKKATPLNLGYLTPPMVPNRNSREIPMTAKPMAVRSLAVPFSNIMTLIGAVPVTIVARSQ